MNGACIQNLVLNLEGPDTLSFRSFIKSKGYLFETPGTLRQIKCRKPVYWQKTMQGTIHCDKAIRPCFLYIQEDVKVVLQKRQTTFISKLHLVCESFLT